MVMVEPRRIAIVGAGPIGLEAALFAKNSGYEVDVFERGETCRNVQSWGHVRLFSPFGLNASAWGQDALNREGQDVPAEDDLLTGREFTERYLLPLSGLPQLANCIHPQSEVQAIGREALLKQDLIGNAARKRSPFRLLVDDPFGERIVRADYVFDCSGTYGNPNRLGAGGIPCPGELDTLKIRHDLPDILGTERDRFANRRVLVAGSGYSAATAVASLAELSRSAPETRAVWVTRKPQDVPIPPIEDDPLTERVRLTRTANELATCADGPVEWRAGWQVQAISSRSDGRLWAALQNAEGFTERIAADEILALVGYRPDRSLYEELQVHECYASQGPMKLAAALSGETSADCLAQTSPGGETLENPEPGFFILARKATAAIRSSS